MFDFVIGPIKPFVRALKWLDNFISDLTRSPNVLTADEKEFIAKHFKPADQAAAVQILENAKIYTGFDKGLSAERIANGQHRVLRSALMGSHGNLEELERLAEHGDFRDVIRAGEYKDNDKPNARHVRVYDLTKPFQNSIPSPALSQ